MQPDEVVALGAALQGLALTLEEAETIMLDVTPHTLGVMGPGGHFEALIPAGTTVPTSRARVFTTVRDNQTELKIVVMQGESHRADENELLGEFKLDGMRRAPAGEVEIEVTFEINSDGIVSVHAKDLETSHQHLLVVTTTTGLTKEEIRDMVSESGMPVARLRDDESKQILHEPTFNLTINVGNAVSPEVTECATAAVQTVAVECRQCLCGLDDACRVATTGCREPCWEFYGCVQNSCGAFNDDMAALADCVRANCSAFFGGVGEYTPLVPCVSREPCAELCAASVQGM